VTRATRHKRSRPVGRPCNSRTRVCVQGSYQDELMHGQHAVAVGVDDFEHLVQGVGVHEGGRRGLLRRHTLVSCDVCGSLTCRVGGERRWVLLNRQRRPPPRGLALASELCPCPSLVGTRLAHFRGQESTARIRPNPESISAGKSAYVEQGTPAEEHSAAHVAPRKMASKPLPPPRNQYHGRDMQLVDPGLAALGSSAGS